MVLWGCNVSCPWIRKVQHYQYTLLEGRITLLLWWLTFFSCPPSHSRTPGSLPCTVAGWNTYQHQFVRVKVTTGDIKLSVCRCVGQQCIPPPHSGHIYGVCWDYSIWRVNSPCHPQQRGAIGQSHILWSSWHCRKEESRYSYLPKLNCCWMGRHAIKKLL